MPISRVTELLVGKDEGLLVVKEAFLILDFGLDVVNGIARSHFQGDSPGAQGSDNDLHVTMGTEDAANADSFRML